MSKRPWMPLYIADYLADTMHLTAAQSGAYLHLIMHYWQHEKLPTTDEKLARIARMRIEDWNRHRGTIKAFFHGRWRHARIDGELHRSAEISNKRKAAAKQKHSNSCANAPANAEQMHTQSQSQSHTQKKKERKNERKNDSGSLRSPSFDLFWNAYPHKVGKQAAIKAFEKALKRGITLERMLPAIERYKATKPVDRNYCNPATWLNEGRWDDEPALETLNGGTNGHGHRTAHPATHGIRGREVDFVAGMASVAH
jgi:uncharacterized protein YdaU (DUF1376 family)